MTVKKKESRKIPLVKINDKGYKYVESHLLSIVDLAIYRDLQYLGDLILVHELRNRHPFSFTVFTKSLNKLSKLGYVSIFDLTYSQGGSMAMANN